MFRAAVLTTSDRGARGEREDKSGELIKIAVEEMGGEVVSYKLVPDDRERIAEELVCFCDQEKVDLILTTGGTGVSPRDNTPDATLAVIDRQVPGLAEAMRAESFKITPHALLSRAVCGIRRRTLIINLPGSPKAVKENLSVIVPAILHALELIQGKVHDCAQE